MGKNKEAVDCEKPVAIVTFGHIHTLRFIIVIIFNDQNFKVA